MQNKEDIIKTYLFAICARHPKADKESLLQIWLQEFDYLNEKEEYLMSFMTACRQVINDSSLFRLPSPDDIKCIITQNLKKPTEPLKEQPKPNPKFIKVVAEWKKTWIKRDDCNDKKEKERLTIKMKELAGKMLAISGGK